MKLSSQLICGFGVSLFLLSGSMAIYQYTIRSMAEDFRKLTQVELKLGETTNNIKVLMLQARKNEADFLTFLELRYAEQVKINMARLIEDAIEIRRLSDEAEYQSFSATADKVIEQARIYAENFQEVAVACENKGLTIDQGIQGTFQRAVQELADKMKEHQVDDLYQAHLMLWITEKEYIQAGLDADASALNNHIGYFYQLLDKSACNQAIKEVITQQLERYEKALSRIQAGPQHYSLMVEARRQIKAALKSIYVHRAEELVLNIRQNEKDYLLHGDEKYVQNTHNSLLKLILHLKDSGIPSEHIAKTESLLDVYRYAFGQLVVENRKIDIFKDAMHESAQLIENQLEGIHRAVKQMALSQTRATIQKSMINSNMAIIIGIAAILFGVVTAVLTTHSIVVSINKGVRFARIVAQGDLTAEIEITQKDEVGMLADALRAMVFSLQTILKEIRKIAVCLSEAAEELSSASMEMAANALSTSEQSDSASKASDQVNENVAVVALAAEKSSKAVAEIADMTLQMSSSFANVTKNAKRTADYVRNTAESGNQMIIGINSIGIAVEQMTMSLSEVAKNTARASQISQEANERARTVDERVNALAEVSDQIGEIVGVIKTVATQTNLLALNAAIEAVSAGNAGKGFGVVANEVKELARQTAASSDQIAGRIKTIQASTSNAALAIRDINRTINEIAEINEFIAYSVKEQTATAAEISKAFATNSTLVKEVSKNANESADYVTQIAVSTEETFNTARKISLFLDEMSDDVKSVAQSAVEASSKSEMIFLNIRKIFIASEKTSNIAVQIKGTAEDMANIADSLSRIIRRFTL